MAKLTEMVFILDRSGSMGGLESDTIGGYNSLLEKQKREEGEALVTTVLFDDRVEIIHDRVDIKAVSPLTDREYYVRGCTALLDAIGDAIHHIDSVHRGGNPAETPQHTLFFITTDGLENASRRYSGSQVRQMIRRQEELGWEFLFVAANIDAAETAERIGIRKERAANYRQDSAGTKQLFESLGEVACSVRRKGAVSADWAKGLEK